MAKCLKFLSLNLENFRRTSRLNKAEFATKIGVSPSYLSQLLGASNDNPGYDVLEMIAESLDTTVSRLLADPFAKWEKKPSVAEVLKIIEESLLIRAECQVQNFDEIMDRALGKSPHLTPLSPRDVP